MDGPTHNLLLLLLRGPVSSHHRKQSDVQPKLLRLPSSFDPPPFSPSPEKASIKHHLRALEREREREKGEERAAAAIDIYTC